MTRPENYFTNLVTRPEDHLVGGRIGSEVDKFFISNDLVNQSKETLLWNTLDAELAFVAGEDKQHQMYLPGIDQGARKEGFQNNFAWGVLDISGQSLELLDGNADDGGAFYAGEVLGAEINGNLIANIFGHGLNIYYDPLLAGNDYLHGLQYALQEGGMLAPFRGLGRLPEHRGDARHQNPAPARRRHRPHRRYRRSQGPATGISLRRHARGHGGFDHAGGGLSSE